MNAAIVLPVTLLLIAASAFFVVIEFALLGARRPRLEQEAATSAAARAALRGMNELTMMLAVAQLGITVCTFALGAVTKPAVDAWLAIPLAAAGLPDWLADALAFAIALLLVTLLHLVVGEMAPKSWAIAHPERAAKIIALPARAMEWALRPLLVWINRVANRLVAASGVEPADRAAVGGQDAETIRQLVDQSAEAGTLDARFHAQLDEILDLQEATVAELVATDRTPTSVPVGASIAQVQDAAARSGHMRILIVAEDRRDTRVVHVRDTLLDAPSVEAAPHARPALALAENTTAGEALRAMRESGEQLAVLVADGRLSGVVTVSDILAHVLPRTR
ncbi:CNNM domain-containing protein [Microbacterium karelineae]|uniref:CNNM domain-containing protein n=1 Tax=Microbacterium karelineae TaxID=2654283 RepID=UPI0012EAD18F|nr:CNNM domain-containing protein [Microbacterium karelineae]